MTIEVVILEDMLDAGEYALQECRKGHCDDRETAAAVYAAMQTMAELQEQRKNAGLVH